MSVKMNFRIKTKNHAADPENGFLTKSISKPNGSVTAMPPAWELKELCGNGLKDYEKSVPTTRQHGLI